MVYDPDGMLALKDWASVRTWDQIHAELKNYLLRGTTSWDGRDSTIGGYEIYARQYAMTGDIRIPVELPVLPTPVRNGLQPPLSKDKGTDWGAMLLLLGAAAVAIYLIGGKK